MEQRADERNDRPDRAIGGQVPESGMQYMLGIGLAFVVVTVILVFYNAMHA